jgi:hypothetical protein
VKLGTPFENDFDTYSVSGNKFECNPKSWCSFTVDHVSVPAKAAKADVLATRLAALEDDIHFEEKPLWEDPGSGLSWPHDKKYGDAAPAAGTAGSAAP